MDIKFCTNKFCLNNEVYLKYVLSMMKSKLNLLIVSSKYNQAGRNILNLSSILFLSERSEIRIMPNIYQKQLNLWIRGWHSITDMNSHGNWLFRLSRAGPFSPKKKVTAIVFGFWRHGVLHFLALPIGWRTFLFDITKHVLICMM